MVAAGLGYIDFAIQRPALFRLIFSSNRPDFSAPDLAAESLHAYQHLTRLVEAMTGGQNQLDVSAVWAMAHGLADLMAAGRLSPLAALPPADRDQAFAEILSRSIAP